MSDSATMTAPRRSTASNQFTVPPEPGSILLPAPKIIVTVNSKGGVGKSTISTLLALELVARGYVVNFVDCDPQASSSNWLSAADSTVSVHSAFTEKEIFKQLRALATGGVIVIADGPAKNDSSNRMLMCMADIALLPCGPSALELEQLTGTVELLEEAKEFHIHTKGLPLGLIVPNQLQHHTLLTRELVNYVGTLKLGILPALQHRQVYKDCAGQRTTVKNLAGRGADQATREIDALVSEVLTHLQ